MAHICFQLGIIQEVRSPAFRLVGDTQLVSQHQKNPVQFRSQHPYFRVGKPWIFLHLMGFIYVDFWKSQFGDDPISLGHMFQMSIYQHLPVRVLFDSKGWCFSGTPYHPFSTLWKIQVAITQHIFVCFISAVGDEGKNLLTPTTGCPGTEVRIKGWDPWVVVSPIFTVFHLKVG